MNLTRCQAWASSEDVDIYSVHASGTQHFLSPVRWLDSDKMFVLNDVKFHLRVRVEPIHTIRSVANDAFATDPAKSNIYKHGELAIERERYTNMIFSRGQNNQFIPWPLADPGCFLVSNPIMRRIARGS